ncbi:uncharacterized protein LOC143280541 [Babylonia areolata]|uniref:uncharacterized protein LOC143280541 n=1 Tax=Babylonia areolata TaxID=304850 RepID=UPI003FD06814
MRDLFSHRAIGKDDDPATTAKNMATTTTNNNTTENGGGGVVSAVSVGGGGSGGSGVGGTVPSSPIPDWTGDPVMLKEFASKRKLPGFARVVKGSYMTIGSSKFSLQKQHHEIYIHSVKMGVKVLAHCVKRMDVQGPRRGHTHTRLYSTDQRLTVPLTYQGWFELLSEDGKSARPITSVPELAKAFPSRCLVRENIKGYLSSNEGRMTFDKTKIIPAGEQLKLCGELSLPAPSETVKVKLLRCVDSKGDNVFLSFDQKGLFTPISGENDFTGVFNIRDIVRRFRLPLTVKLVQGVRPRVPDSKFTGIIRLDWVYTEETAFVCPLEKNHVRLLPVPCDVALQLVAANNREELCASEMFKSMQAKCSRMVSNYNNTLHLIVNVPESVMKTQARQSRASSNFFSAPLHPPGDPRFSSSSSSSSMRRSKSREDILMDEIDDLYGYVRDGGAVPPKVKFQYDSDEESYWEEPAYEPLDQFRARLKAMESGQKVSYPDFYRPADPTQLKGLVGGTGPPGPPPPGMALPLSVSGEADSAASATVARSDSVYGVISGGGISAREESAGAARSLEPPPLPPRPAEMGSAPSCSSFTSSTTTTATATSCTTITKDTFSITVTSGAPPAASSSSTSTSTSSAAAASQSPARKQLQSRRVSAPLLSSSSQQSLGLSLLAASPSSPDNNVQLTNLTTTPSRTPQKRDAHSHTLSSDSPPPAPPAAGGIDARAKRVSRSDSEPSITTSPQPPQPFPTSSAEARPRPTTLGSRQQSQEEAVKLDWKERLRRFNAMEDRGRQGGEREGGSSSASSGSTGGQRRAVAQRLARDFKDSDISSRTKATSSSSGGQGGVRKRMQTLYL